MIANRIKTLTVIAVFFSACSVLHERQASYLTTSEKNQSVVARNGGVSTISPIASKVGIYILEQGGNAVDAAIAIQLALAVVHPEAGNLGGGGFMTLHMADGTNKTLDFREVAPAAAFKEMYLDKNGNPDIDKSLRGHLASGVPGTVAGLFESMKYASLPFAKLIQPAIDLAEKGYVVTYGLNSDICPGDTLINTQPNVFDGRRQWKEGDTLQQPDLAKTLKRLRDEGRKDFYEGKTAQLIVEEMKRGGGLITLEDLKNYQVKWREPQIFTYRGYTIVSMPLPSSGGVLLNQMLKMIEPFPVASYGFGSVNALNLMIEACRRAYRDRAAYLGDGDFSDIPVARLVSDDYLNKQMRDFTFGRAGASKPFTGFSMQPESKETTHFSVVDRYGNAVAVTTTLNMACGCGVYVGGAGFLLNNEMNDFSLKPGVQSAAGGYGGVNNSIAPGKRMLSSMTPTIVLKGGKFFMVLGTPGGTTIPTTVFQTIVNVVDFNMTAREAAMAPKFHHEWMPDVVTMGKFSPDTIQKLKEMGYHIEPQGASYLEIIKTHPYYNLFEIASERGAVEGY